MGRGSFGYVLAARRGRPVGNRGPFDLYISRQTEKGEDKVRELRVILL